MPINWPPPTAPAWPPPEIATDWLSCSSLKDLLLILIEHGFTQSAPTAQERNLYFKNAQCDHLDPVIGRMLVNPGGAVRYPFAVCNNPDHRDFLVLWPPYYCGWGSGIEP